jgi:hypothetical protein
LRFEVEEILVEGGPWSTRMATRYAAKRDGKLVYRGVQFTASLGASSSKNEFCLTRRRFLPDSNDEAGAGPVNR